MYADESSESESEELDGVGETIGEDESDESGGDRDLERDLSVVENSGCIIVMLDPWKVLPERVVDATMVEVMMVTVTTDSETR